MQRAPEIAVAGSLKHAADPLAVLANNVDAEQPSHIAMSVEVIVGFALREKMAHHLVADANAMMSERTIKQDWRYATHEGVRLAMLQRNLTLTVFASASKKSSLSTTWASP